MRKFRSRISTRTFQFRISDLTNGGADGFSFNVRDGGAALEAGAAGESGTNDGLAVQFDTFQFADDPSSNFVRLRLNGATLATNTNLPFTLKDGNTHTAAISLSNETFTLRLDGTTVITQNNVNLSTISPAYVGFAARTGGSAETHDILSWSYSGFASRLIVTKTEDTNDNVCDADCSLREAIAAAQPGDTIGFASPLFDSPQTITLTQGELAVTGSASLIINGTGANRLSISGNNASRVFFVGPQATLTLNNLTVTGGKAGVNNGNAGAGIYNNGTMTITNSTVSANSSPLGAGITNSTGMLTLTNSIISGNSAPGGGGAGILNDIGSVTITNSTVSGNSSPEGGVGGGIFNNSGTVTITDSTINGNSATDNGLGGGIFNGGTVNLTNSTVSGNSSSDSGGGIYSDSGCTLNLTNSTISSNSASNGGGIFNASTVRARNTIISGNRAAFSPNLNGSLAVNENNIIDNEANVRLAPLGFYGGATQTHALLPGSSAINAGNDCVLTLNACSTFNSPAALSTDQRGAGYARKVGSKVDIGAFEFSSLVVTNTNNDGAGSLRAAIAAANSNPAYDAITFEIPSSDAGCTNGVCTITLTTGELSIAAKQHYGDLRHGRESNSGVGQQPVACVQCNARS